MEQKAVLALFGTLILFSVKSDAANCPDLWTGYQNSCYLLIPDAHTWYNAKATCETLGGHLVEIENADENYFVAVTMLHGSRGWIGLEDFLMEGHFVWATSGQRPTYTNWLHGQPDDGWDDQDCGEINDVGQELWNDLQCDVKKPSVCERQELQPPVVGK